MTRTGTKSLKFPDLRSYLSELQKQKELVRIEAEVDADQEIAEIHRRVIAAQGPALLFTNVRNSGFPVVTNLFGVPKYKEWDPTPMVAFSFAILSLLIYPFNIYPLLKVLTRSPVESYTFTSRGIPPGSEWVAQAWQGS